MNYQDMPTMAEQHFRVACIKNNQLNTTGQGFTMWSRNSIEEETYKHGYFTTIEEAVYSIEQRCESLEIRCIRGYAKRLIEEAMF